MKARVLSKFEHLKRAAAHHPFASIMQMRRLRRRGAGHPFDHRAVGQATSVARYEAVRIRNVAALLAIFLNLTETT